MDEDGNIYARGSQDMKNLAIKYLEAIRRLKLDGVKLKRTLHVCFVPDEEIGGETGMKKFIESEQFQKLNVGFALDEGVANPTENFYLSYGERCTWNVWIRCTGNAGHASNPLIHNTAGEKLRRVVDKFMDFRTEETKKFANPNVKPGDITTVNLTMIQVISFLRKLCLLYIIN